MSKETKETKEILQRFEKSEVYFRQGEKQKVLIYLKKNTAHTLTSYIRDHFINKGVI